jgi:hypothetical protein
MTDHESPISPEELARLTEGLSNEARTIWERMQANLELLDEMRQASEEIMDGFDVLPGEQQQRLLYAIEEHKKASERKIREAEAQADLSERLMAAFERARELDPSLSTDSTTTDVIAVLKAYGEPLPISEDELNAMIEVPPPLEDLEWVAVPASEIPTDKNGIPTRAASKDGFGIPVPDETGEVGEVIKLYPRQVEAMRALASRQPYREFVEDHLDKATEMKREFLEDMGDWAGPEREGFREQFAQMAVSKVLTHSYQQALAMRVKAYPYDPQGIIDACKERDTKAARKYKDWVTDQVMRQMVDEQAERLLDEGIFIREVGGDGQEYIRKGPNYEAFAEEVERKKAERGE